MSMASSRALALLLGYRGRKLVVFRVAQLQQRLGSVTRLHQHHRSAKRGGQAHSNGCDAVNAMREMLLGRRSKGDPNGIFSIVLIRGDAVEWPVIGLHLIAHIRAKHFQPGMRAAVVASKIVSIT